MTCSRPLPKASPELLKRCADTIRMLSVEAIERANSGHPGAPMGMADLATVLWTRYLRHDPRDPAWMDRDRLVLSAGHASMLLYSLLHLGGFGVSMEDIKAFRQWGSPTPGHPEYGHLPGVEVTTGPLGQGFAHAVGMAIARERLHESVGGGDFNPVSHRIFTLMGDGCMMEGVTQEAASLAGHLGLGNLVAIYDDNGISIDGPTSLAFSDDTAARFRALGWHTVACNGHDYDDVAGALDEALSVTDRPSLILAKTTIGHGAPNKCDDSGVHGAPLGGVELAATRAALAWDLPPFEVPDEVRSYFAACAETKQTDRDAWDDAMLTWRRDPERARRWDAHVLQAEPGDLRSALIASVADAKGATRQLSAKVLKVAAEKMGWIMGGSADLTPSNGTMFAGGVFGDPASASPHGGRYIHYGVREHAMGAVANGLTLHGSARGFTATFLVFADYMRPPMRLAALMGAPTIFVFTHDSIFLGEDGPTHQPVEHLASLRVIPGMEVFRPADNMETAMAWYRALVRQDGPVTLSFTRQGVRNLDRPAGWDPDEILRGGYVVHGRDIDDPDLVLIATGSEVGLAMDAAALLGAEGHRVRVVSMPCQELFDQQDASWRNAVIPAGHPRRVSIEAGATQGWRPYVGDAGLCIGLDRFGASAPAEVLAERFGFIPDAVVARIKAHFSLDVPR
ncbi:MAG: transketolase [Pseudomonadota bacterium]